MKTYEHRTLQVFEHQWLVVGSAYPTSSGHALKFELHHFDALVRWNHRHDNRFLTIGHRRVKFESYVGLLQIANLSIEILPKAGRDETPEARSRWQRAMLEMMRTASHLPLHRIEQADQSLRARSLLELYIDLFLTEVERLLHEGLLRRYRQEEENLTAFRGRLVASGQVRENLCHRERFYVAHHVFDHAHLLNQILLEALCVLRLNPLPQWLSDRVKQALVGFVDVPRRIIREADIPTRHDRQTSRYEEAIRLAWLILSQQNPMLRDGSEPFLALLFDMERLFELYVGRMLARALHGSATVKLQPGRPFWRTDAGVGTHLRPDTVVEFHSPKRVVILDTKWKLPLGGKPSSGDLHQMYLYNQYFEAVEAILLYPSTVLSPQSMKGHFIDAAHGCRTAYLELFAQNVFSPDHIKRQLLTLMGLDAPDRSD